MIKKHTNYYVLPSVIKVIRSPTRSKIPDCPSNAIFFSVVCNACVILHFFGIINMSKALTGRSIAKSVCREPPFW